MIAFPFKRIFGLIGAPRAGKDSVAQFLQETRDFKPIAFADRIKEEFGISKEDFEAAKIAGNIDDLRDRLWAFSAEKKKDDPLYFINLVVKDTLANQDSVVITDIRTPEELEAAQSVGRVYWVSRDPEGEEDNGVLRGSKLNFAELAKQAFEDSKIRVIDNLSDGLFGFYKELDKFFFMEDIMDLSDSPSDRYHKQNKNGAMMSYMRQFKVSSDR